ncbi:MAG: DUF5801 repeats-in-toxin domain-containing protein [Pseudomonadota bacterium]
MATITLTGAKVTLDESASLQNLFATPTPTGDADDNDIAVASLPSDFSTRLGQLNPGTAINGALSGYNGSNTGANVFTVSGSTGMGFTNSTGGALNGDGSGLKTVAGDDILLYTDTNNNILLGKTAGGTVVFAAYLEETGTPVTGAKVWTVEYQAIQHTDTATPDDSKDLTNKVWVTVDATQTFSLSNAPSGQNLFMMLGDPLAGSTTGIVVTGKKPADQSSGANITTGDTVNTSQGGGSTTIGANNQMIDYVAGGNTEGMYFTFVKGVNPQLTVPNLDQGEADLESNIQFTSLLPNMTSASFSVVQLQKDKAATVKLTAFQAVDESGNNFIHSDGLHNASTATIDAVTVKLGNTVIASGTNGLTVAISGGTATVTGVKAGYEIQYHTTTDHTRLLVENVGTTKGNTASFDIGGFSLLGGVPSTQEIGSKMFFEDDGPTVALGTPTDTVVLNTQDADTIGSNTDSVTQSFASAFPAGSSGYGTDGAGSTSQAYSLAVNTQGGDSGLKSDGATVYLYLIGGMVIGSTSSTEGGVAAGNTIFDLAVSNAEADAGSVTLQQFAEIDHALPGTSSNYATQQAVLGDGKISLGLTATLTDGDGDIATDTKSIDLGGNIKFDDDGPAITLGTPTDDVVLNTQDADTIGGNTDSNTQSYAASFSLGSSSYGADGAGTTVNTYSLAVNTQGGDSGLKSDGATVYLYLIGGKVIGSTSSTEGGVVGSNTIFDLAVSNAEADAGSVTLQQFAEIDHALPGSSSNYATQQAVLADGKISLGLTAVITDGDGDTATDTKSIDLGGNVKFDDDGPSGLLGTPTDTVVLNTQDADTIGSNTDSNTQSFAASFSLGSSSYGADGAGTTVNTYSLAVNTQGGDSGLKSDGATVYLYLIGGKVIGSTSSTEGGVVGSNTIFDLAVSNAEADAGSVTLQQFAEIDHALPGSSSNYATQQAVLADGKISLGLTAVITDGDGDTATDTKSIDLGGNIKFDDDGPAITLGTPTDTVVLNTQDADTLGANTDSDVKSYAASFSLGSSSYGADGAGTTVNTYSLAVNTQGGDSGLKSDGATVYLYLIGGMVIGSTSSTEGGVAASNTIFDLAVSNAQADAGSVTLQQFEEIDHDLPGVGSNYAAQQAVLANGKISLGMTAVITDGDGDTATDTKSIDLGGNVKFDDHGPTVTSIDDLTGANDGVAMQGNYTFAVGADDVLNLAADGIVLKSFTGTTGGGRAITNTAVAWASETSSTVTYDISFKYYPGPSSTTQENGTGTVVFNKVADGAQGTFTLTLAQLVGGVTTFSTSTPLATSNYDTEGNNSPEIVVQKYSDTFYGVLSAKSATPPSDTSDLVSGADHVFTPGETFSSQSAAYVNIATDTVGVNSDTVQNAELLNFDYYTANPVTGPTSPPASPTAVIDPNAAKAYADEVKITLDQITSGEDIAVLLKLYDKTNDVSTTRLLLANNAADYVTAGSYKVVTVGLDDYDSANYKISGVQVVSSTEDLTGTGYALTGGAAVALGSTGTNYQDSADPDVFKIIKIEVTTSSTTTYDVDMNFVGQVIDGDADYADFNFDAHVEIDGVVNLLANTPQSA